MIEVGFFVKFGDVTYSQSFEKLSEARNEAKNRFPEKKLEIYHGMLNRVNDQIIDDSKLSLVPRIGGYK